MKTCQYKEQESDKYAWLISHISLFSVKVNNRNRLWNLSKLISIGDCQWKKKVEKLFNHCKYLHSSKFLFFLFFRLSNKQIEKKTYTNHFLSSHIIHHFHAADSRTSQFVYLLNYLIITNSIKRSTPFFYVHRWQHPIRHLYLFSLYIIEKRRTRTYGQFLFWYLSFVRSD